MSNVGYNAKGGASYTFAEKHSVYGNAGVYSRQPYHDNIYLNYTNAVNPLTSNEDIVGLELGYGFKSSIFSANVNAYRTSWKNRVVTSSNTANANTGITGLNPGDLYYKTNLGVEQIHSGVELDFVARPTNNLDIKGFASFGDWVYANDVVTRYFDENLNILKEEAEDVDGGMVGDAAQTTWGLGAKYQIFKNFSIDADWRNYSNLYANVGAVKENLMLPDYDLVDAGISYRMFVGKEKKDNLNFRVNMNNVFDEVYLSELTSNTQAEAGDDTFNGINTSNRGFFGWGRTWNVTVRYNF